MMKINLKMLSIPPYISTSWKNVATLHVEMDASLKLVVFLKGGERIEIPGLTSFMVAQIFKTHADYLEEDTTPQNGTLPSPLHFLSSLEPRLGTLFPPTLEEKITSVIQHDPDQKDAPSLPSDFLKRLADLPKLMGIDDPYALPKAEENCNCLHCQIANALCSGVTSPVAIEDETVTEEDLHFRDWEIQETGHNLYTVTNPLDSYEQYTVHLGEPVGCTCGQGHCEHIVAVLKS